MARTYFSIVSNVGGMVILRTKREILALSAWNPGTWLGRSEISQEGADFDAMYQYNRFVKRTQQIQEKSNGKFE